MGAVFSKMEAPLLTTPYLATILRLTQIKKEAKKQQPRFKTQNGYKEQLMDQIETILDAHPQTNQYRDGNKKIRFNLEWSMLLGHTTNALGAKSFETPHNFKPGRGVYVKPMEERNLSKWKKELWALSKELIKVVDPDFADGEYVVNYSCMTKPEQYVKKHVDSDDISYQYALALGNYSGANLRCYDEKDNVLGDFDYHRKICKMDGRLPHELLQDNFKGKRFCIIWFKLYDHRKTQPDPIYRTPQYVPMESRTTASALLVG
jgi:hypothetical protein